MSALQIAYVFLCGRYLKRQGKILILIFFQNLIGSFRSKNWNILRVIFFTKLV